MTDMKRVSPQEALELTNEGWVYVDVRTEQEFAEGHPASAFNVPIAQLPSAGGPMTPNLDFVSVMESAFGKEAKIVVGCKAGGRSLRAAQALVGAGFSHVIDQRAGWDGARDAFGQMSEPGWSRAGLPAETGPTAGRTYADVKAKTK
jgi:rhodanese-related sulfurtransferase